MLPAELPNRSLFKPPEVCEIAQLQPYVLRSWEAEFPDLGVTRAGSASRVYRRGDVERVLRLKHLLFVEGLTLAGARRRLEEERTPIEPGLEEELTAEAGKRAAGRAAEDKALRRQLTEVRQGLKSLLDLLQHGRAARPDAAAFELRAQSGPRPLERTPAKAAKAGKAAPAAKSARRK